MAWSDYTAHYSPSSVHLMTYSPFQCFFSFFPSCNTDRIGCKCDASRWIGEWKKQNSNYPCCWPQNNKHVSYGFFFLPFPFLFPGPVIDRCINGIQSTVAATNTEITKAKDPNTRAQDAPNLADAVPRERKQHNCLSIPVLPPPPTPYFHHTSVHMVSICVSLCMSDSGIQ